MVYQDFSSRVNQKLIFDIYMNILIYDVYSISLDQSTNWFQDEIQIHIHYLKTKILSVKLTRNHTQSKTCKNCYVITVTIQLAFFFFLAFVSPLMKHNLRMFKFMLAKKERKNENVSLPITLFKIGLMHFEALIPLLFFFI